MSGTLRRHTVKHDMESLLYVIFYCALLWLEHDQTSDVVGNSIKSFFERYYVHIPGAKVGGNLGKADQSLYNEYLGSYKWTNTKFHWWLNTMFRQLAGKRREKGLSFANTEGLSTLSSGLASPPSNRRAVLASHGRSCKLRAPLA